MKKNQFLTIILILVVLVMPNASKAETAVQLAARISSFTGGGTGALNAVANGDVVTVTGELVDVVDVLWLPIDEEVTIEWLADISSCLNFYWSGVISLNGSGIFNVKGGSIIITSSPGSSAISVDNSTEKIEVIVSGGIVSADICTTIQVLSTYSSVTVIGGKVASDDYAISTKGSVEVSGGEVSSLFGSPIYASGDNSTITVNGGTVSATGYYPAINVNNVNNTGLNVIISGTGKVESTGGATFGGAAIKTYGSVEIKDNAEVSSLNNSAISTGGESSKVYVSGGTVSSGGTFVIDVRNENNTGLSVIISGNGSVLATGVSDYSPAIITYGSIEIKDNAQVSSLNGGAISAWSGTSNVSISGGTVTGGGNRVIEICNLNMTFRENNSGMNVFISGTSKIIKTNDDYGLVIQTQGNVEVNGGEVIGRTGYAIYANGNVEVNGGKVSATSGMAIFANGNVEVKGGLVFAYGNAINGYGNVIYQNFTGATGTGIVIAWNESAGNSNYTQGSTTDISQSPATATAVWGKNGSEYGISYTNGTNSGFIPLNVTVYSAECDVLSVQTPTGATITGQTITASVANSVTSQIVAVTTSPDASWKLFSDAACTSEIIGKVMTLAVGNNTAYIEVNAEDGSTKKVYTIVISRADAFYNITIAPISNGNIIANVNSANVGSTVTLTITPDPYFELFEITAFKTGDATSTITLSGSGNSRTFTMPGFDVTVSATFKTLFSLSVEPESLSFSSSGGEKTFLIESNIDWTINSNASWISFSPESGSNNCTITVTIGTNPSVNQRTGIISVTGSEGVHTVTVTQEGAIPTLSVSPTSINFTASGGYKTFLIESNTNWTITCSGAWISVSPYTGSGDRTIGVVSSDNTDGEIRSAIITISATGGLVKTINVFQEANVDSTGVVSEETKPVGEDGKGNIELSLSIPGNVTLTGSFEISFPEGMTLDEQLTVLSLELSGNFYLSFTYKGNNTWLIEIKSNSLKSSTATEYRKIMDIAYIVDENVKKGVYKIEILNLDFVLSDNSSIKEDAIEVLINVERTSTSIEKIHNTNFYAFLVDDILKVESSYSEIITVYSVSGIRLYSTKKTEGLVEIPFTSIPGSVFIVKGDESGVLKVMR